MQRFIKRKASSNVFKICESKLVDVRTTKESVSRTYPFLEGKVLSSDAKHFNFQTRYTLMKKIAWLILNSQSWIKGVDEAVNYAKANNLKYELAWGLNIKIAKKMAKSRGLIFFRRAGTLVHEWLLRLNFWGASQ